MDHTDINSPDSPEEFSAEYFTSLPDDFAADKEIQRLRRIEADEAAFLDDCVRIVSEGLSLEPADHEDITAFELFRSIPSPLSIDSYAAAHNGLLQASLIEYQWVHQGGKGGRSTGTDHCLVGLQELNKSYPLTYIYKETFRDRLVDWFVKGDVDFKHQKKFSRSFHVVSKDKEKLSQLLWNKRLDDFLAFPNMLIEINGNRCVFRVSPEAVSEEEARQFVELAETIRKIFV